jgi:hypothetical protein
VPSGLHQEQKEFKKMNALKRWGAERHKETSRGRLARRAPVSSAEGQFQSGKLCRGVERSNKKKRREADDVPSGLHQEQIAFDVDINL